MLFCFSRLILWKAICLSLLLWTTCAAVSQNLAPQQINILPIADQTYGVAPFQVIALASPSFLPVTLTVQGPATLNGRLLTITGVGTVTVFAQQAGNAAYAPTSTQMQFSVLPGMPSIQAQAATIVYGTALDPSIFGASATAVPVGDPSADIPAVTWQLDTSQINGGGVADVTIPYSNSAFRFEAADMVEVNTPLGGTALAPDPTVVDDHNYKIALTCDCQQFEFVVESIAASYRIWVDGSWTTTDSINFENNFPRTVFYKVAFPDKRVRQIKIDFTYLPPFYGLVTEPGDTISAPQVPIGKKTIVFGDSWTGPTILEPVSGESYQPGLNGSGYAQTLGEYFNWDWWENGGGGSGFVQPGAYDGVTWVQRVLTDVCGHNPDRVVVFGGGNDGSYPEAQIQQAATLFLDELHTCLPTTPVYLLGPQGVSAGPAAAMAAAAALYPETVTYSGAPQHWIYGDPNDPTSGNAYLYLNGHPTPLGHDYLAEQVALSVLSIDPALAPQPFTLFAPAPASGTFSYSPAAGSVLAAGQQQISATFTPQDSANYTTVSQPVTLTVSQASSSLALSSTASSLQPGSPLTLTAVVSPQIGGVPTGTVNFTDSGQLLGSVPLNSAGVAAFTSNSLAEGNRSISASYSGDRNFLSSSAASPLPIVVEQTLIGGLTPASAAVGAMVQIRGAGFGVSQGTSTVTFNSVPAAPVSWSDTSIQVPVPPGATTGIIAVTVDAYTSSPVSFIVLPTPAITSLSSTAAAAGATVTIAGSGFGALQGSGSVSFNGAAATVASWSNTSIVAPVPAGATTGNVSVYASGVSSNNVTFTVLPTPLIAAILPASAAAGANVTIAGTGFGALQGSGSVSFNGAAATVASWSNTSIVAPVPTGATTGNVSVYASGVSSNNVPFTVLAPAPPVTPDFSFTIAPAQLTVIPGQSQTVALAVSATGGFTGTLNLSCTGLPANASCSLQEAQQITVSQSTATAQLLITAFATTTAMREDGPTQPPLYCAVVFLLLLRKTRRRPASLVLSACFLLLAGTLMAGCGGGSLTPQPSTNPNYPAPGSYTVQVTLTNSSNPSMAHTQTLAVTIQ